MVEPMDVDVDEQNSPCWRQVAEYKDAIRAALHIDKPLYRIDEHLSKDFKEVNAALDKALAANIENYDFAKLKSSPDTKILLEHALKTVCVELVGQSIEQNTPLMEFKVEGAILPSIPQILDLSRYFSSMQLCDIHTFLWLLIDIMESLPVSQSAELFQYIETCIPYLRTKYLYIKPNAMPKLRLLYICNHLLSRLSRVQDTLLAGRIHFFLSQLLPSTDQSAVNMKGSVNEANPIIVEKVPEDSVDTKGDPVNAELYEVFWSLQSKFQNPISAIDPNAWAQVHTKIKEVLAEFQKVKCTVASGAINQGVLDSEKNQENLTVRFIPSPKLLSLQIKDAGFRRHFLLQCLILIHAGLVKSTKNQETFRIKQQGDADDLIKAVHAEIQKTPEKGHQFSASIKRVMQSEDQWADWKANGAQSFDRQPQVVVAIERPTKKRKLAHWKHTDAGSKDRKDTNGHVKQAFDAKEQIREYFQPVIEDMDPQEGIEEPYKRKHEATYKWEAMRKLAQYSYNDFGRVARHKSQDLEVAVHDCFPDLVPAGVKRDEALPSKTDSKIPSEFTVGELSSVLLTPPHEKEIEEPQSPEDKSPKDEKGPEQCPALNQEEALKSLDKPQNQNGETQNRGPESQKQESQNGRNDVPGPLESLEDGGEAETDAQLNEAIDTQEGKSQSGVDISPQDERLNITDGEQEDLEIVKQKEGTNLVGDEKTESVPAETKIIEEKPQEIAETKETTSNLKGDQSIDNEDKMEE